MPRKRIAVPVIDAETDRPAAPLVPSLSLRQFHGALRERGGDMSYTALSEFINEGDIAQQLNVGGKGNRKEFPLNCVDIISRFVTVFDQTGAKRSRAPYLLSRFLAAGLTGEEVPDMSIFVGVEPEHQPLEAENAPASFTNVSHLSQFLPPVPKTAKLVDNDTTLSVALANDMIVGMGEVAEGLRSLVDVMREQIPSPQDCLLTAEEAARLLACKPRSVSRYVRQVLPRKWRESDIMHFIEGLSRG